MRQLLPELVDDADPEAVHASLPREPPEDRPFVLVNMIESIDGAAVVDGVSGGLGGEGDKIMFRAVRAVPDIILVAARTANAERYSAPRVSEASREARRERGQSATPRLAVVTGQLSVDLSLEMFTDPGDQRPLVITAEAAPTNRRDEVEAVAEILVAGETNVDLTDALRQLRRRGATVVLGEGGPSMNGGLVDLDLVDEWCISLSPTLAGGDSRRIVNSAPPALRHLALERVFEHDGMLFLRYLRR
ncbi:MAG TPA: dihydrofolate reductase family protein [Acidimicrobiales bacterium]